MATTAGIDAKINDIKNKIPYKNDLATTTALTAVKNKIPNVSNFLKKTDYTKITEIEIKITNDLDHGKYITTQKFNKLTSS